MRNVYKNAIDLCSFVVSFFHTQEPKVQKTKYFELSGQVAIRMASAKRPGDTPVVPVRRWPKFLLKLVLIHAANA